MPSSGPPNEYARELRRFFYRGMSLLPQDALGEGKQAFAINIRSHIDGTFEPRYGQILVSNAPLGAAIHSIVRLNDTTPYNGGTSALRLLGSSADLAAGIPGIDTYAVIDTGYSGDPLTGIVTTPAQSPRPYAYFFDRSRQRKVNTDQTVYPIGIAQPNDPPTAALAKPETTFLGLVGSAGWVGYGGDTTPASPAPAPTLNRVNTALTFIGYDNGFPGMASVAVVDFDNVTAGMSLDIGAAPETVIVHSVYPAIASTTIAAILYDAGVSGLCTIQPTGSFSAGQIEAALPVEVERRYRDMDKDLPPRVTVTRTVDYPVDALVQLNGGEIVRILSIAIGVDGVQSFRCSTVGTFSAGQSLDGVASFRAYFTTLKAIGDPAVALALEVTLTPGTTDPTVGGVQSSVATTNWNLVGTRASQPEDLVRFGIKVSELGFVTQVRLVLDLSLTGPEFLRDYLFYEWRASDLIAAIQATGETATGLIANSKATAVVQGQVEGYYSQDYAQEQQELAISPFQDATSPLFITYPQGSSQQAQAGNVSIGAGVSRQLSLGNDSWITLECRLGDMTRVGTDTTLTLGGIQNAALIVQVENTIAALDLQFSDCYLVGGYGPDVGTIMPPYVYRYSYRSTITGARSNPSPPMRGGIDPRRGRVHLQATPSLDAQCDQIDFWRFGGALARWAYVGTQPNDSGASPFVIDFNDDMADRRIEGGERIRVDLYQPWPTSDLPRSGTATLAGTALSWASGDVFNPEWAADSLIVVNSRATQLYQSPTSTTFLQVVENCGSGTVNWSMPSPTLLSQELPGGFGGFLNDVYFMFAVGDPQDPGALHWSNGNDADSTADKNVLYVASGDTPLLHGFFDDGIPYIFSTEKLYRITPTFGSGTDFRVDETACQRGLWSKWFWCRHPDGGVFFGNKDGIYYTRGGSVPESLVDPDFRPLFPQEGTTSEAIRNLNPIDFTQTNRLKLTFVDQVLYFDYQDTDGDPRTFVIEPRMGNRWTADTYAVGVSARLGETGPEVETHLMGGVDGNLRQYDFTSLVDVDAAGDLADIPWALWTPWSHGGDPRNLKQWGDAILDFNPGGSLNGVQVTPVIDNGNVALDPRIVGIGNTVRDTYIIEVGAGGDSGYGVLSRNFGLWIEGAMNACDTQRPIFYLWEPAFFNKQSVVARRATDWEDLGYPGAKFVQGIVIRANTFGIDKCVAVEFDGPNAAPQQALVLTLNHDGEQTKAYPLAAIGWTPFIGQLVRLRGLDDDDWTLLSWRWVFEPAPEAATQWETQETTFDYPGFMSVRDGVMAYQCADPVTLRVWHDLTPLTYTLPATGSVYQRVYIPFAAAKGKAVKFSWTSISPVRVFKRDTSIRVQAWGISGGYSVQSPFGGPSREDGAGV